MAEPVQETTLLTDAERASIEAVRDVLVRRFGRHEGERLHRAALAKMGRLDSGAYAKWVDAAKEATRAR